MNIIEKILSELGFIRPLTKPDWDNVAKAYCDMIIGYLIYDDSQIIEGSSSKYYSSKPRIEIELEYMEDYDSNFNRRKFDKKG
jgi:Holliday junction resolvase RusA-like endonuclease